jgi:hypothetical protein
MRKAAMRAVVALGLGLGVTLPARAAEPSAEARQRFQSGVLMAATIVARPNNYDGNTVTIGCPLRMATINFAACQTVKSDGAGGIELGNPISLDLRRLPEATRRSIMRSCASRGFSDPVPDANRCLVIVSGTFDAHVGEGIALYVTGLERLYGN